MYELLRGVSYMNFSFSVYVNLQMIPAHIQITTAYIYELICGVSYNNLNLSAAFPVHP